MIASEPVIIKKKIKVNKKQNFSSEKIKNSGICIYDYAEPFFGEDF